MEPYYEFWMCGEKLLEDSSLVNLLDDASVCMSNGVWNDKATDIDDILVTQVIPVDVTFDIKFTLKKKNNG